MVEEWLVVGGRQLLQGEFSAAFDPEQPGAAFTGTVEDAPDLWSDELLMATLNGASRAAT
jgi:hypothetical protein